MEACSSTFVIPPVPPYQRHNLQTRPNSPMVNNTTAFFMPSIKLPDHRLRSRSILQRQPERLPRRTFRLCLKVCETKSQCHACTQAEESQSGEDAGPDDLGGFPIGVDFVDIPVFDVDVYGPEMTPVGGSHQLQPLLERGDPGCAEAVAAVEGCDVYQKVRTNVFNVSRRRRRVSDMPYLRYGSPYNSTLRESCTLVASERHSLACPP